MAQHPSQPRLVLVRDPDEPDWSSLAEDHSDSLYDVAKSFYRKLIDRHGKPNNEAVALTVELLDGLRDEVQEWAE